jgi:hypothetical protein
VPPKRERSAAQKKVSGLFANCTWGVDKTGQQQKTNLSDCHALCKKMLEEDGWRWNIHVGWIK